MGRNATGGREMTKPWAGIALLLASALAARADPVTLRFASTLPLIDGGTREVAAWLKKTADDSGGTLQWQQYWDGQLIGNPAKEYDAMLNGVSDATIVVTPFVQSLFPDFSVFAVPFVVDSAEEAAVAGWRMYERGMIRGLDKVHVAAIYSNDIAGIHLAKPIKTLDELKGLKIRVSGPAEAKIVEAFGAVPVGMNIMQAAEALTVGTYEGTLNGWGGNHAYRMTPVLKSHVEAPLGVRIFFLGVSKAAYDKLSPQAQHAIDANSGYALSVTLGKLSDKQGADERAESEKLGQIVINPTEDEARALGLKFRPLLDQWIASTPDGAAKYQALRQILADYHTDK
jgi:TRAP-type transport system periplasmic protein